ncbi:hypothetical protein M9H77_19645 [Catharanthus roseus]|uniref:Uncharacterized protein n=1 Tax=Catharanthus roseus TaxID=4058 RepID=A0ACC0BB02_CATRO|nr:hypothetical protein M9H77_19645 [Catharanthus roseus]
MKPPSEGREPRSEDVEDYKIFKDQELRKKKLENKQTRKQNIQEIRSQVKNTLGQSSVADGETELVVLVRLRLLVSFPRSEGSRGNSIFCFLLESSHFAKERQRVRVKLCFVPLLVAANGVRHTWIRRMYAVKLDP